MKKKTIDPNYKKTEVRCGWCGFLFGESENIAEELELTKLVREHVKSCGHNPLNCQKELDDATARLRWIENEIKKNPFGIWWDIQCDIAAGRVSLNEAVDARIMEEVEHE